MVNGGLEQDCQQNGCESLGSIDVSIIRIPENLCPHVPVLSVERLIRTCSENPEGRENSEYYGAKSENPQD